MVNGYDLEAIIKRIEKLEKQNEKPLGQIAYEAAPGYNSMYPWNKLEEVSKKHYQTIAEAVKKELE